MTSRPDPEALLVALVLCPLSYSRNRFFELFRDPTFFDVRRRAKLVRSVIAEVVGADPSRRGQIVSIDEGPDKQASITYVVPSLGLKRTTALGELDLALVRYALARRGGQPLAEEDLVRARIEDALQKLAPDLSLARSVESGEIQSEGGLGRQAPSGDPQPQVLNEEDGESVDDALGLSSLPDRDPER